MKFGSSGLLGRWAKGPYPEAQATLQTTTTLQESKLLFSTQTLFHHTFCFSHTINFWAYPRGLVVSLWEDTAQSICSTKLSAVPSRERCGTLGADGCQLALLGSCSCIATLISVQIILHPLQAHTRQCNFKLEWTVLIKIDTPTTLHRKTLHTVHYTEQKIQYFKTVYLTTRFHENYWILLLVLTLICGETMFPLCPAMYRKMG